MILAATALNHPRSSMLVPWCCWEVVGRQAYSHEAMALLLPPCFAWGGDQERSDDDAVEMREVQEGRCGLSGCGRGGRTTGRKPGQSRPLPSPSGVPEHVHALHHPRWVGLGADLHKILACHHRLRQLLGKNTESDRASSPVSPSPRPKQARPKRPKQSNEAS